MNNELAFIGIGVTTKVVGYRANDRGRFYNYHDHGGEPGMVKIDGRIYKTMTPVESRNGPELNAMNYVILDPSANDPQSKTATEMLALEIAAVLRSTMHIGGQNVYDLYSSLSDVASTRGMSCPALHFDVDVECRNVAALLIDVPNASTEGSSRQAGPY